MHEVERRAEIVLLADAPRQTALAPADAPEVEPQHRAADASQRFRRLIHGLRVHRAAVLRVRMAEDDGRRGPWRAAVSDATLIVDPPVARGSSSSASSGRPGP